VLERRRPGAGPKRLTVERRRAAILDRIGTGGGGRELNAR
jgi:hypothetical protein